MVPLVGNVGDVPSPHFPPLCRIGRKPASGMARAVVNGPAESRGVCNMELLLCQFTNDASELIIHS